MITIISDMHGKYQEYLKLTKQFDNTIQLGDFGFNYDILSEIDHNKHKFFFGNHENFPLGKQYPHWLGYFGQRVVNGHEFFFVGGANSIDKHHRTPDVSWFPEEELSTKQMDDCILEYEKSRPKIVLSHDCPTSVCIAMHGDNRFPSNTDKLLEIMFSIHKPEIWIFGHHHKSWRENILGTGGCMFE